MKSLPLVFFALPILSLSCFAHEVKPGETTSDVRLNLGAPRGEVHVGDREFFYYDRGEIEAKAGVVTRASLRSDQEQAAFEAKRALEAKRIQEEGEIRQARLIAEGEALKTRKLSDTTFLTLPLSVQMAFWEGFSRHYPGVASTEQLLDVRARFADEAAEKLNQAIESQRLSDLESRVAVAENEARIDRGYGYEPYGFSRGYSSFGSVVSYRSSRDYGPPSSAPAPVTRIYEFPLPYATSPGMPPMRPIYRNDDASSGTSTGVSTGGSTDGNGYTRYNSSSTGSRRF